MHSTKRLWLGYTNLVLTGPSLPTNMMAAAYTSIRAMSPYSGDSPCFLAVQRVLPYIPASFVYIECRNLHDSGVSFAASSASYSATILSISNAYIS